MYCWISTLNEIFFLQTISTYKLTNISQRQPLYFNSIQQLFDF